MGNGCLEGFATGNGSPVVWKFRNWLRKRNEAKWKNNGKELEGNAESNEMEMKQMSNE
jgi:hypothetical protein